MVYTCSWTNLTGTAADEETTNWEAMCRDEVEAAELGDEGCGWRRLQGRGTAIWSQSEPTWQGYRPLTCRLMPFAIPCREESPEIKLRINIITWIQNIQIFAI